MPILHLTSASAIDLNMTNTLHRYSEHYALERPANPAPV